MLAICPAHLLGVFSFWDDHSFGGVVHFHQVFGNFGDFKGHTNTLMCNKKALQQTIIIEIVVTVESMQS